MNFCRFSKVIFVTDADFRRLFFRQMQIFGCFIQNKLQADNNDTLSLSQEHRQIQWHRYLIVNHTDIRHTKFIAFFNAFPHKHGIERL